MNHGISLFLDGKLQPSLILLESLLAHDAVVADIHVLVAQVLVALGSPSHIQLAKQQLLSRYTCHHPFSISTIKNNIKILVTLFVLGLVTSDWTLAQTSAVELMGRDSESMEYDIDKLLGLLFLFQVICPIY
jgi:hypothetical protein